MNAVTGSEETSLALRPRGVALFLLLHVVVWTTVATVGGLSGTIHHDMAEAYDWGREFQLGYSKHPPIFAWIAGVWFLIFPRADWAFYLLSAVNAAGGLAGVWTLAGQLLPRPQQTAALYLTALTPLFSVLAVTFNANAILLLVWPWTVFAFVRSIESRRTSDAAVFGFLAAVSMLAKYSSILLLATCLAAALLHPGARAYFATKLPRIAVGVAILFVIPHAVWALSHHLTTVEYVYDKQHPPLGKALQIAASSLLGSLSFLVLALLAFAIILGRKLREAAMRTANEAVAPQQRWQTVLAVGLPLLTVVFALRFGLKVSTNFLFPTLFMIPIMLLVQSGAHVGQAQLVVLRRFVAGWFIAALALAPVFAYLAFAWKTDQAAQPRKELAEAATAAWRDAFHVPLVVVAGSEPYSVELPFYSSDTPSFYDLSAPAATPWVTPERIARDGLLIVCASTDANCLAAAVPMTTQRRTIRVSHAFLGARQTDLNFELFLAPPNP